MPTTVIPEASAPAPAPAPVHGQERLHVLDILRGFALFGMIVVHFHQRVDTQGTGWEDLIAWFTWIAIEQKSWGTFAFLFGVGFAVLLRRLEAKGLPFVTLYLRRLLVLALFGIVAEMFFGYWVLLGYAFWGVPLLFLRRLGTRTLLAVAVLAVTAQLMTQLAVRAGLIPTPVPDALIAQYEVFNRAVEAANQGGSFLELASARLDMMGFKYFSWNWLIPDVTLALFIVGLLAVRIGVFDQPRQHLRVILGAMTFGLISWAIWWTFVYPSGLRGPAYVAFYALLNEQYLSFTYIGALTLLVTYRPVWLQRLSWFGWAGRMALTNYMLQVAVLDFIVSGYGLQLKTRPVVGMLCAVLLFSVEVIFSRLWLSGFRFGPLEWVWRSLTYGKLQPMQLVVARPEPVAAA